MESVAGGASSSMGRTSQAPGSTLANAPGSTLANVPEMLDYLASFLGRS